MPNNFRHKILDSQGQIKSLENSHLAYTLIYEKKFNQNEDTLILLGLGPEPENLLQNLTYKKIFYFEYDKFLEQGDFSLDNSERIENIISLIQDLEAKQENFKIYYYQPNSKLFPEFWYPILAQIKKHNTKVKFEIDNALIICGSKNDLLIYELLEASNELNYKTFLLEPENENGLLELIKKAKIEALISINLRGLNNSIISLLKAFDIPIKIWLVDNPLNIINDKILWKDLDLFVSSSYFVDILKAMGAKNINFLPLASSQTLANKAKKITDINLLFVGRTKFTNFDKYFASQRINEQMQEDTQKMIKNNYKPDLKWWKNQLNILNKDTNFQCEVANIFYRTYWLNSLKEHNLQVFGDEAWKKLLDPKIILHQPVDYYTSLFSYYKSADFTLNLTSLLLPEALTQRNFDVWLAGGFLLSNSNNDMDIFSIAKEKYSANSPIELAELMSYYQNNIADKLAIIVDMQTEIQQKHLYKHRLIKMLGN